MASIQTPNGGSISKYLGNRLRKPLERGPFDLSTIRGVDSEYKKFLLDIEKIHVPLAISSTEGLRTSQCRIALDPRSGRAPDRAFA